MSSCTRARDLFGTYWDDETSLAERTGSKDISRAARRATRSTRRWPGRSSLVASLPREETAPDMAQRALAAARRAAPAPDVVFVREAMPRWVPVVSAAAALLVVAALAPVLLRSPGSSGVAQLHSPVPQPRLVAVAAPSSSPSGRAVESGRTTTSPAGTGTEGLFDHTEDVDLVLDPVTLHRGRAHTVPHLPEGVQGEQAVITF